MNIILGSVSIGAATLIGLLIFLVKFREAAHKVGWKEGYSEGHKAADNWWIGAEAEAQTVRQQIWRDEARTSSVLNFKCRTGVSGSSVHVATKRKLCACGCAADLLCDWKVKGKNPACAMRRSVRSTRRQVGPDKTPLPASPESDADSVQRLPGVILPPDYQQHPFFPNWDSQARRPVPNS